MTRKKTSNRFKKLSSQLPDIEKHITDGEINVIPLPLKQKYTTIANWQNITYSLTEPLTYKTSKG